MSDFAKALKSILHDCNNFCCLCFQIYDAKHLLSSKDEASFVLNNNRESIVISDLILTILGGEFTQYLETLEFICDMCITSLINSYTFIQTCTSNAMLLTKTLEGLNKGIQEVMKPEDNTLFMSISLNDFTTQLLYDNELSLDTTTALKRYQILTTPRPEQKPKIKEKIYKYTEKELNMLFDPSNCQILQCKVCLKVFSSMVNLRNHYTKAHHETKSKQVIKTNELTCKECGRVFKSFSTLKLHQDSHGMIIVCHDCGRTYKNKSTFKNHLQLDICKQEKRHSPSEAKYTCDYCNKKYTQKVSLRVHIQFEHGNYKAHICEWCGKKFWAQSRLKAHIVKHTRERNFSCQLCQRKFVTKESLLYHTRLHTGEKPYKCPHCTSRFLSASRRSDHVKRYHGANPYLECDVCHSKFRSKEVLLRHRKVHKETVRSIQNHKKTIYQELNKFDVMSDQKYVLIDTINKCFVK